MRRRARGAEKTRARELVMRVSDEARRLSEEQPTMLNAIRAPLVLGHLSKDTMATFKKFSDDPRFGIVLQILKSVL